MSGLYLSLATIKKKILHKSIKKILLISGQNTYYKTGAKEKFKSILKTKETFLYIKKSNIPDYYELKKIISYKNLIKPDFIIAIGGGCVMDYAKICSVVNSQKNLKEKIINSDLFYDKKVKVLAIPTTTGSGAEVTSNAVIYINNIKYSVEGDNIKPDFYSIVPEFLISSSRKIDASSGFDAISQAIESLFSKKSNPSSILFAKKSLNILLENYISFLRKKNLKNSYKMALGANLAGKAISISKTTAPHALSYPFTALYNVPHGHAVSLTLNKFLKFNYFNLNQSNSNFDLNKRFDLLFKLTNTKDINQLDDYLLKIKKKAQLEQNFFKLGVNIHKDYYKIIKGLNEQRLKNNPIKISIKDIQHILKNF
tara:strand:- start:4700 stop:5806 length:1107 start_codon:yes stop_codon:yes gene_type:complete